MRQLFLRYVSAHQPPQRRTRVAGHGLLLCATILCLPGCVVGPDFVSPKAPDVQRYTAEKLTALKGGSKQTYVTQRLAFGQEISQSWWGVFRNKDLDDLVEAAIDRNPSLPAAKAAIKVAFYNAEAQKGNFLPAAVFDSNDTYNLESGQSFAVDPNGPSNPYALYLKQLTISYTPDIWGQNLRNVESLEAQTDQARYQLEAAYLTLTTNVVTAALQEACLRGQIDAVQKVIAIERDLLLLLKKQKAAGYAAEIDVLTQEAALAQAIQLLPPLEKQLAQGRDLLTVLAGSYASSEVTQKFYLKSITIPRTLPVSLPSELVRRRPDVRAAEANMHAASALIGVAVAARLPNVTLSAVGGYNSFDLATLFAPGMGFYTLAGNITQPVFDGFTLLNKQKSAEAALEQADAQYRGAVLTAFQNVADALQALQSDTKALKAAIYAEDLASRQLNIIKAQLQAGTVNVLSVLNAEQTYLQALQTHVQAEGNRLADVAGLFMALGGDWQDQALRDLPPNGPNAPTPEQVTKIQGPVNSSWIPSFW